MELLCGRVFLLLFTVGVITHQSHQQLSVRVEPVNLTVCVNATARIKCSFQPSSHYKVQWIHIPTNSESQRPIRTLINTTESSSVLQILHARVDDSGWYYCKVLKDRPFLMENQSNRAHVVVVVVDVDKKSTDQFNNHTVYPTNCTTTASSSSSDLLSMWWIWSAFAVGSVVLLISIVAVAVLSCKPKDVVYENTQPRGSRSWKKRPKNKESSNFALSKKPATIKPLKKYDTLSNSKKLNQQI